MGAGKTWKHSFCVWHQNYMRKWQKMYVVILSFCLTLCFSSGGPVALMGWFERILPAHIGCAKTANWWRVHYITPEVAVHIFRQPLEQIGIFLPVVYWEVFWMASLTCLLVVAQRYQREILLMCPDILPLITPAKCLQTGHPAVC